MSELTILPGDDPTPQVRLPPQETAAERARRMSVALSPEVEGILRQVSGKTRIPIGTLRRAIEESPQVQAAAKQALRFRYDEWWNRQKDAGDIFGSAEPPEEP